MLLHPMHSSDDISLLRSWLNMLERTVYKHSVPTGLSCVQPAGQNRLRQRAGLLALGWPERLKVKGPPATAGGSDLSI